MRRLLALLTAVSMVISTSVPVFADSITAPQVNVPAVSTEISPDKVGDGVDFEEYFMTDEEALAADRELGSGSIAYASRSPRASAGNNDYYYSQLNDVQKEMWHQLDSACRSFINSSTDITSESNSFFAKIQLSGFAADDADMVKQTYRLFYYTNPQYYFLSHTLSLTRSLSAVYLSCYPDFRDAEQRRQMMDEINAKADKWAAMVNEGASDLEREYIAIDIIAQNTSYVKTDVYNQSLAGVLYEGQGVCNAYAMAFKFLCDRAGMEAITITSETHAWNMVNIGGTWYETDVTWYDTYGEDVRWINKSSNEMYALDSRHHAVENEHFMYAGISFPDCSFSDPGMTAEQARSIISHANRDYQKVNDSDEIELYRSSPFESMAFSMVFPKKEHDNSDSVTKDSIAGGSNYYYNKLTDAQRKVYNSLTVACDEFTTSNVNITDIKTDTKSTGRYKNFKYGFATVAYFDPITDLDFYTAVTAFKVSNPQYFWTYLYYTLGTDGTGPQGTCNYAALSVMEPCFKAADRKNIKSKIDTQTNTWLTQINRESGNVRKVKKIAKLIADKVAYDNMTAYNDQTMYSVYMLNKGVCNAYANTFLYLCALCGIDCVMVSGPGHAWNRVKLGGDWYECDVTWYDTTGYDESWLNISTATLLRQDTSLRCHNIEQTNDPMIYHMYQTCPPPACTKDNPDEDVVETVTHSPKISSVAVGNCKTTVKWAAVPDATAYKLYMVNGTTTKLISSDSSTAKAVTGLVNGTKYGFYVTAVIGGKETSDKYITYATPKNRSIKVTAVASSGQAVLSWSAYSGASKYAVYKVEDNKATALGTTTALTYTVKSLSNGKQYGFYVIPYESNTYPPFIFSSAEDKPYVTYVTIGAASPKITAIRVGSGKAEIEWNAVAGATSYRVYKIVDGKETLAASPKTTKITLTGLENGKRHTFYVKAIVGTATTAKNTAFGTPRVIAISPDAIPGNRTVSLSWKAVSNAQRYALYQVTNGTAKHIGSTTGTTFTAKELTNGTSYGFYALPYINNAYPPFSVNDAADKPSIVYVTPGDVSPVVKDIRSGNGRVQLSWDAIAGATQYRVYKVEDGKESFLLSTTATSCELTGLTNGKTYGFYLRALVGKYTTAKIIKNGGPKNFGIPITLTPGNKQIRVSWSAYPGAERYAVYQITDGKARHIGSTTSCALTALSLTNGTDYGFYVLPYVDGAYPLFTFTASPDSSYVKTARSGNVSPVIKSVQTGNGRVQLTWNAVSGASSYRVYMNDGSKETLAGSLTGTSLTVTGLVNDKEYSFYVKAVVSKLSTAKNIVKAVPHKSGAVVRTTPSNSSIALEWDAVSGAEGYAVYIIDNGKAEMLAETAETEYTAAELANDKEYGFYVLPKINGAYPLFDMSNTADAADIVYASPVSKPAAPEITEVLSGNGRIGFVAKIPEDTDAILLGFTKQGNYTNTTINGPFDGTYTYIGSSDNDEEVIADVCVMVGEQYSDKVHFTIAAHDYGINVHADEGDGEVSLSWDAYEGAKGYRVYSSDKAIYKYAADTSVTIDELENDKEYGFYVYPDLDNVNVLFDPENDADKAYIVYCTPHETPAAPEIKVYAGEGRVMFTADEIAGIVYRYSIGGSHFEGSELSYSVDTDSDVSITAVAVKGIYTSEEVTVTASPKKYACYVTAAEGHEEVTLTWDEFSGASGYRAYMLEKTGESGYTTYSLSTTDTACTFKNLTDLMEYKFYVLPVFDDLEVLFDISNAADAANIVSAIPHITPNAPVIETYAGEGRINFKAEAIDGVEYSYTITGDTEITNQADKIDELIASANDVTITAVAVKDGYTSEETVVTAVPRQYLCNITEVTEGDGQVSLTWEADPEAHGYQVLYHNDENSLMIGGDTEDTSFTVEGLDNNTEYDFLVMPLIDNIYVYFDWNSETDKPHIVTATPHYTPDMPEVRVSVGEDRIVFEADETDGITYSYTVRFSDDPPAPEPVWNEDNVIEYTADFRGRAADTETEFMANAVSGGYSSEEFVYTGAPRQFACDARAVAGSDKITLTWDEDYEADGYEVYLYDGADSELIAETDETEYTVEGLEPETDYAFYILPVIEDVNILFDPAHEYDAPHILYVTTADISPEITSISPGNHCAKVRWNTLPGATLYRLTYMIDDVPVRTMEYTAESNATMVKGVYNLDNGTEYGFYVTAYIGRRWTTAQNVSYAVPDDYNIASTVTLSGGTVTITWDMAEGAELYQIYEWNRDNNSQRQITSTRSNSAQIYINTAQNGEMWFAVQPKYTSFGYPFFRPEADNTDFSYEHHVTWTDGVIKIDP